MLTYCGSWCTACQEVTTAPPFYTGLRPHHNLRSPGASRAVGRKPCSMSTAPALAWAASPFDHGRRVHQLEAGIASTSIPYLVLLDKRAACWPRVCAAGQCGTPAVLEAAAATLARQAVSRRARPGSLADAYGPRLAVHLGRGTSKKSPPLAQTAVRAHL